MQGILARGLTTVRACIHISREAPAGGAASGSPAAATMALACFISLKVPFNLEIANTLGYQIKQEQGGMGQ